MTVQVDSAAGSRGPGAPQVQVTVADASAAAAAGVDGVLFEVESAAELDVPVQVSVDYSAYADAFGGDWASRLQLVPVPGCDLDADGECASRGPGPATGARDTGTAPVSSVNDQEQQVVSATFDSAEAGTFALMAAESGPGGDWSASPLAPSATWDVSARTGNFTWSYPFRTPPAGSYPAPQLGLGYSSGSVDGRVADTNNQASWIGEGWGMSSGFIERSYVPCVDDTDGSANNASLTTGDLCWGTQNATLQLDGQAYELILDETSGQWQPRHDNGMRIERLTGAWNDGQDGEYWRVTATDGTQYFFGRDQRSATDTTPLRSAWTVPVFGNHPGEPCYDSVFADSWCEQVWRWNLDYVVDTTGNSMTYFYQRETNRYGLNLDSESVAYDRGGYLSRIDYAQREGQETSTAPARVSFDVAERCLPSGSITCAPSQLTSANAEHWPDVPYDLICTSTTSCPDVLSPVFFTRKRLVEVTTSVLEGGSYRSVDQWELTHSFPDPGDATSRHLWLEQVQHTGRADSPQVQMPPVTFAGVQMPNRVDELGDNGPPMNRYRISSITTETGATTSVNYTPIDCTAGDLPSNAHTNTRRCFPVTWDPEGSIGPIEEYFHKYLVSSTVDHPGDGTSHAIVTNYDYQGGAAWHYTDNDLVDPEYRTWRDFRGYAEVEVSVGDPSQTTPIRTVYEFFRGMHGDRSSPSGGTRTVSVDGVTDHPHYAGIVRTETSYDGAAAITATTNTPWQSAPTATGADGRTARYAAIGTVDAWVDAPALPGGERTSRTITTYDAYGMPIKVDDRGDLAISGDERCTRTEYVRNTSAHIVATHKRQETVSVACAQTPSRPADVLSDTRTLYDGGSYGTAPTQGLVTVEERLTGYSSGTPTYETVTEAAHDATGRLTAVTDALGRTTTTSYTPTSGGLATQMTVTSPDPDGAGPLTAHTTTTALDPAWGSQTQVVDPNGKVTTGTYDAIGRLTDVWRPGRVQGTDTPHVEYEYSVSATGTNTVTTSRLIHDGTYLDTITLYDGLLRERQTQSPTADRDTPGRIVAGTVYDSRGLVSYANAPWYTSGSPATTVIEPVAAVPLRTSYAYDGAGRQTAAITEIGEDEQWRTSIAYGGDRATTTPPDGGVPTTEISDVFGQLIELRTYEGATPTGSYDAVTYDYDPAGQRTAMTDADGNTWTWDYDLRGRLTSQTDPDTGTSTHTYDAADQRLTTTDARGETLHTTYDHLGRRTELRENNATGTLRSTWDWDTLDAGQLTSSTRHHDGADYTTTITGYDDGYRPLGHTLTLPTAEGALAGDYTTSYTYTLDGQPKTTTYPAAGGLRSETVTTYYDNRGMPEWTAGGFGWGVYVSGTDYSVYGEPLIMDVGASHANLINYSYQYGTRRPDQSWLQREGATSYDLDITYTYDDAGNLLGIDDDAAGDTQCFTYNQARLHHAWTPDNGDCSATRTATGLGGPAPYWHTYTHDDAGNRTSLTDHRASGDITTTYDRPTAGTNQAHTLTETTTTGPNTTTTSEFTYDDAGNTLTRDLPSQAQQTLTWDPEGRLETLTQGTSTDDYIYTPEGQRLVRHQDGETTVYLPGGQELALDAGTITATRYYSFNGQQVAARTSSSAFNGDLDTTIADHHHTATITIANTTNDLTRRYFDPYGNPRGPQPVWVDDHGFLNKPTDTTGLTHIGARYYDPTIGQFISPDPIIDTTNPHQWNPYTYANANPTTLSDPTGLIATGGRMIPDWTNNSSRINSSDGFLEAGPKAGKGANHKIKPGADKKYPAKPGGTSSGGGSTPSTTPTTSGESSGAGSSNRAGSASTGGSSSSPAIASAFTHAGGCPGMTCQIGGPEISTWDIVSGVPQLWWDLMQDTAYMSRLSGIANHYNGTTRMGLEWAEIGGADCEFDSRFGQHYCYNAPIPTNNPAMTIGNVVWIRNNEPLTDQVARHEARHSTQWAVHGPGFAILYGVDSLIAAATRGNPGCGIYEGLADYAEGGYHDCY